MSYDLSKLRVSVIGSNAYVRGFASQILLALGMRNVKEFESAIAACRDLDVLPVDLVVVDWFCGELQGLDFVRKVRQRGREAIDAGDIARQNIYVPILIFTAESSHYNVVHARDAGANEFLTLPLSLQALIRRLSNLIESPREFVCAETYFGPDRRRRDIPHPKRQERRGSAAVTADGASKGAASARESDSAAA